MMGFSTKISLLAFLTLTGTTHGQITNNNTSSETEVCLNPECNNDNPLEALLPIVPQPPAPVPVPANTMSAEAAARVEKTKKNSLWQVIDKHQGGVPFGKVLDAGTGLNSLQWIASLADEEHGMTSYTAITGSKVMYDDVTREAKELGIADMGEIIYGNWFNKREPLVLDEMYDTIFVDYLIGAMDAFSPYQQDMMLKKLVPYLKPGGRMYAIALEPIPDYVSMYDKYTNSVEGANLICQMRRIRDSCALLAGNRPYREYPMEWMIRQFEALDEMNVLEAKYFPNLWDKKFFSGQINNGRQVLNYFPTPELAKDMDKILNDLEAQFLQIIEELPGRSVKLGFDYLITAEKKR